MSTFEQSPELDKPSDLSLNSSPIDMSPMNYPDSDVKQDKVSPILTEFASANPEKFNLTDEETGEKPSKAV